MAETTGAHICQVCGAALMAEECNHCNGSGDDPDLDMVDGRYVVRPCFICDGSGVVHRCPNDYDAAHQAAYERDLQRVEGSE